MTKRKSHQTPKGGQVFTKIYKGKKYNLETVKVDGKIKYKVGKQVFDTPTGAAKKITQNSVNGWIFWGLAKRIKKTRGKKTAKQL